VIKGFGREAYEHERFRRHNAAYYDVTMRAARADEIGSPLMECLGAVGVAVVVWYGGYQVIAGVTTPGTFFSFLTAIFMLYEPMRKLGRVNNIIQSALAAAERTFAVLDTPDEWVDEAPSRRCRATAPAALHGCVAALSPDGPLVLRDVSLMLTAGNVVALVGQVVLVKPLWCICCPVL
jgi:subfamily B ATP-binding cassette protein MsbA